MPKRPKNYEELPDEMKQAIDEEVYAMQSKSIFTYMPGSPHLKSSKRVEELYRGKKKGDKI